MYLYDLRLPFGSGKYCPAAAHFFLLLVSASTTPTTRSYPLQREPHHESEQLAIGRPG
jgi:hypothetical protein